jgi:hypothetical protein
MNATKLRHLVSQTRRATIRTVLNSIYLQRPAYEVGMADCWFVNPMIAVVNSRDAYV